jgi:hypothetical protein
MRDLWMDHIVYTRLAIISFAHNLPDFNVTADRLLQNQVDIGNAIKPYYGEAAGDQLTGLLKQHILIAVDILKAPKANNTTALDAANKTWFDNADQIATFLSSANPNLPKSDMVSMMDSHLSLTTKEAVDRLHGNYADDIVDFDQVHKEILTMADTLSDAIIKQFPDKFGGTMTATTTASVPTTSPSTSSVNSQSIAVTAATSTTAKITVSGDSQTVTVNDTGFTPNTTVTTTINGDSTTATKTKTKTTTAGTFESVLLLTSGNPGPIQITSSDSSGVSATASFNVP